jgi:hypothetical protein
MSSPKKVTPSASNKEILHQPAEVNHLFTK